MKNPAAIEQHKQNVLKLHQEIEMKWNRTAEQLRAGKKNN